MFSRHSVDPQVIGDAYWGARPSIIEAVVGRAALVFKYSWTRFVMAPIIRLLAALSVAFGTLCSSEQSVCGDVDVSVVGGFEVSKSNINVFSTPIAYYKGAIYTINIESSKARNNGINLLTVVRTSKRSEEAGWLWAKNVVDSNTLDDPYHTQGSIGIDKRGYLHIAYNMHNMPWQYSISKKPGSIDDFVFLGDNVSRAQRARVKYFNKTNFPGLGHALIPGTQITYPAFFYDRNSDLYVTYRFALRPKKKFLQRGFAGGIAKYDVNRNQWHAIGGDVRVDAKDAQLDSGQSHAVVRPFTFSEGWTVYLLQLAFDKNNGMHVSWTWREKVAGADVSVPSYAYSHRRGRDFYGADGKPYVLPISIDEISPLVSAKIIEKYFAPTSLAVDADGTPYVLLNPIGASRIIVHYEKKQKRWSEPETSPEGATKLYIDEYGRQWAFATGIKIFMRERDGSRDWVKVYEGSGYCYPKILPLREENAVVIHAQSCDHGKVRIYWMDM